MRLIRWPIPSVRSAGRQQEPRVLTQAAAPSGAMSGVASLAFANNATLIGAGALLGVAALTFSNSGALAGAGALSGSSAITFSNSAMLTGSGALAGLAPITFSNSGTLSGGAAVLAAAETPAGRKQRRPILYRVWVKGKAFVFDEIESLIAFLEREELRQEKRAQIRAERHATRIAKVGAAAVRQEPPRLAMRSEMPEIADYIAQLQSKIDRIYWARLGEALGEETDEEEDIAIIASMLRDESWH